MLHKCLLYFNVISTSIKIICHFQEKIEKWFLMIYIIYCVMKKVLQLNLSTILITCLIQEDNCYSMQHFQLLKGSPTHNMVLNAAWEFIVRQTVLL